MPTTEEQLHHRTDVPWRLADPFDTQSKAHDAVPASPGAFLWLRRADSPHGRATGDVLFVGTSRDLRRRLFQLSSSEGATTSDATLQRLFDVVVAPAVAPDVLRDLIIERKSMSIAQMWIRDHTVFAFAEHGSFYEGWEAADGSGVGAQTGRATLGQIDTELVRRLRPWFNMDPKWVGVGGTGHWDHEITLPIEPRPPEARA